LKVTKANLVVAKPNEPITLSTTEKGIEVELLQINDLIKVYPGSGVAVDGIVIFGRGIVNESMLTGESRPISKDIGSSVYGGSTLIQGNIIVKVTKTAENSSINQIIKLVENAQNSKAPIQGLADTIAKYFVPCIILLSVITWIIWFSYAYSK
jgi:P-type Cu+ transporter